MKTILSPTDFIVIYKYYSPKIQVNFSPKQTDSYKHRRAQKKLALFPITIFSCIAHCLWLLAYFLLLKSSLLLLLLLLPLNIASQVTVVVISKTKKKQKYVTWNIEFISNGREKTLLELSLALWKKEVSFQTETMYDPMGR